MSGPAGDRLRRAIGLWTDAVQRYALAVVLAALALSAMAAVFAVCTLVIDSDTREMIAADVDFRRNDAAFVRAFPRFENTILAVIEGPTPERAEDAAARLAARLEDEPALFRHVYRPGGEAFFRRNGLLFLDVDVLSRMADRLAAAQPLLAALAADPSLRGFFDVLAAALSRGDPGDARAIVPILDAVTDVVDAANAGRPRNLSWQALLGGEPLDGSGTRRFVITQPVLDYTSLEPAVAALDRLRGLAAELGIDAGNGLRLRLSGTAALDQEELESAKLGGRSAGLLSFALVSILLVMGLRSVVLVLATVATLVMGLIWTAAFAALAVGQLNLISVAFAVLFIGIGVDFGIHVSLRYREERAGHGERTAAIRRTVVAVAGALGLAALSAAAGFFSFLPTDYRGLAELGLIAGVGMAFALVANLTVLPALLALLPMAPPRRGAVAEPSRSIRLVQRHARAILVVAAVFGIAGLAAVPLARFDFNTINLKDPDTESVATFLELADDPDVPVYTADILVADPDAADRLVGRLEALPEVGRLLTLASFVPADQDDKLQIIDDLAIFLDPVVAASATAAPVDAAARRAAHDRLDGRLAAITAGVGPLPAAAGRLKAALDGLVGRGDGETALADLEGRLMAFLPTALDRLGAALGAGPVALADLPAGLRERWVSPDGRVRVEVHPNSGVTDTAALRRFAEAVLAVAPNATGTPVILSEAGAAVVTAFKQATAIAFVLIAIILIAVLRRVDHVVLVLAPLALAAVLTVATAVLFGLPFNFANVIVLPLLLGLGVSSGIHLVIRLREEGEGGRVLASSTPRAVLFSALTTAAAFGSLIASGHRGMVSMGQLLSISIGYTLVAMLVVLPALMTVMSGRRAPS